MPNRSAAARAYSGVRDAIAIATIAWFEPSRSAGMIFSRAV
jgi:hypothetical protein